MRKITVITGTRAEYGILRPLLKKIKTSRTLDLKLIVTGIHLLKEYGLTVNDIEKDGFVISEKVRMYPKDKKIMGYHVHGLARGIKNLAAAFSRINPDIVVVFGDRLEPLAATLAAIILRIPVAHIYGGDKVDCGHIDESIRHSITRFAHIHFTPTRKCRERLIKMGEEIWRIYNVGALQTESIIDAQKIKKEILFQKLGLDSKQKLIICIFNPIHLEAEKAGEQMFEIIESLKELRTQTIIFYPNNDAGSQNIIREIKRMKKSLFIKIFPSLSHVEFINLLRCADVLIGNSSSGIIEAPSFHIPVVNIGDRQKNRECVQSVIHVSCRKREIIKAIKKGLDDEEFKKEIKRYKNPYEGRETSNKIVRILTELKLNRILLQKKITY
jgi:GDP/UDP-N,N'-diacetylbacillosamine 2-epimerase (hydrolysing)